MYGVSPSTVAEIILRAKTLGWKARIGAPRSADDQVNDAFAWMSDEVVRLRSELKQKARESK